MINTGAPDVYVIEGAGGPRPIEAVGTSTAAFVGQAPASNVSVGQSQAINNWSEFLRTYWQPGQGSTALSNAVYGFFQNGGTRCFVVNTPDGQPVAGGPQGGGLQALEAEDEVAIVCAPGRTDIATYSDVVTHCLKLRDRVAILEAPMTVDDIELLTKAGTVTADPTHAAPADASRPGGRANARAVPRAGAHADDGGGDDGPPGLHPVVDDNGFGAFYFPGITIRDPITGQLVDVTPGGHVAGIWARTDATRGVHKAPANEPINGALNVTQRLTPQEQAVLNPAGVNCIRYFPQEGIRLWGARTIATSSSEWRYLNVRRLFNMIEESIAEATRWIVFEPNDRTLWKSIRRDIGAFLDQLWRDGALMGATPDDAYFVKCDEETNPPEVIDAGEVHATIGIAPVKPAEFVIFEISQSAGGTEITQEGSSVA